MAGDKGFDAALKGFEVVFFVALLAVGLMGRLPGLPTGLELGILLGLAAFRAGHAVSFNLIFEPWRKMIGIVTRPDSSGAGENNHATGQGFTRALGELVTCPICSGQWAALVMVGALSLPGVGEALVYSFAAAGASEIIHWMAEYFEWSGRYSRERAGLHNRQALEEARYAQERQAAQVAEAQEKARIVALVRGQVNGTGAHVQ